MKKVPNRKRSVKLNKIILQILLLILVSIALITQKENILNILTNKNRIKAGIPGDMKPGDIVQYNHKVAGDPADKNKLKTTIQRATDSAPGLNGEAQSFDASTIDTKWRVLSIDKTAGEITLISDIVKAFTARGYLDYKWYEHNMHQFASIFGYGDGVNKNKEFSYKVISGTSNQEQNKTWKTGVNGVNKSGAKPLTKQDILSVFGNTPANKSNTNANKSVYVNIFWNWVNSENYQIANVGKSDYDSSDGRNYGGSGSGSSQRRPNDQTPLTSSNFGVSEVNSTKIEDLGTRLYTKGTRTKWCKRPGTGESTEGKEGDVSIMGSNGGHRPPETIPELPDPVECGTETFERDEHAVISTRIITYLLASNVYTKKETMAGNINVWGVNEQEEQKNSEMRIGDIIKYDHKTGVKPEDLKTTIGKGTASTPGSGKYLSPDDPVQEQTFDASNINTTWRVFNIDKNNKEIMIVSDMIYPEFKTYGAIDYIWYEHNMHKIASIFGHGKGSKKKEFAYKVGSQLEDTGDTATWKTGINGVPLTGARPLRTEDIEKAFGWTESDIKKLDSKFTKMGENFGGTITLNISYPQRKVKGINQTWDNEPTAKGHKKNVTIYSRSYHIKKSDVPENTYKNILWDWNGNHYFQLGQICPDVYSSYVNFRRGIVSSDGFYSSYYYFVIANVSGAWSEYDNANASRVVVFLSLSDIAYRKSSAVGAHQEQIWEIEEKEKQTLPKGMQIGDIVKYDHKATGVKIEDKRLANIVENQKVLKTTIGKGTASMPGSTNEQNFDANKIDTNWHVWGVDEVTGDVIIVSDNVAPFKTKGAIDYIWYEHNMHQIASIFGYGKGAKKKPFTYKVGSQLEDTGDTATWKTGTNGVPLTGARPLRTEDIEKAFGWTESDIKSKSIFNKNGITGYGTVHTRNIYFPQRYTGSNAQQWASRNTAKAAKKDVKGKDGYYDISKSNVPKGTYRNILWDWNGNSTYQLGQVGLDVRSRDVNFRRGMVYSGNFYSAYYGFVGADTDGGWYEGGGTNPCRVVAFLSSSDITYRKTNAVGAHQEPVWDIELRNNPTKNIKVNMKNEFGENLSGVKFNIGVDEGAYVLSRINLNINSGTMNTFNEANVVVKDKCKMEVLGLPTGADYKIISKYEGVHELTQDIVSFGKENLEYDILIYRKDGDYPVTVTYDEGAKNDEGFSLEGKIKLMDGKKDIKTLKVTLKKGNTEFKFTDVKYFVNGKFKNYTIEYEGEGDVKVDGNGLNVKYTPPKKNYTIKAEFIFDKTLDRVPIKLYADGEFLKNIDLLKSKDYIHVENLPERDSKSGKPITYTIKKGNIPSGYITEISGLKIIIRPVLTLPMSGSDSIKLVGITAGICTVLGLGVRVKNKLIIFFKKYEIMK